MAGEAGTAAAVAGGFGGWGLAVEGGLLVLDFVYHRFWDTPPKPKPAPELTLPRVDKGAPYPIIYGRVRVQAGIPAWCGKPLFDMFTSGSDLETYLGPAPTGGTGVYFMSTMLVLGIPFADGQQTLYGMWAGETRFQHWDDAGSDAHNVQPWQLKGDGTDYNTRWARLTINDTGLLSGLAGGRNYGAIEFMAGGSSQVLVDVPGPSAAHWNVAYDMTRGVTGGHIWDSYYGGQSVDSVPGYRRLLSVGLYGQQILSVGPTQWLVGPQPNVPQYSFEVRSLPATSLGPHTSIDSGDGTSAPAADANTAFGTYIGGANDANPIDIIFDILTALFGKLGIPTSRIDTVSFAAAATTLDTEGHGMSRSWEGGQTASEMIKEILVQIDGTIYEDPDDGKLHIRLARNDYDSSTLLVISPDNCERLDNFGMGGWTGVPNKVRITFKNRADEYRDGSGLAQSLANAVGQDGEVREAQIAMPGVTTQKLADALAARELFAQSRPLIKCSAVVDRTFKNVRPGDVVMLTWPEWSLGKTAMRVAGANYGTLQNGKITLQLVQDFFYVWRAQPPTYPGGLTVSTPGSFSLGGR